MLKMKISRLHLQTVKVAWGDENWELHQPTNTCMHTHTPTEQHHRWKWFLDYNVFAFSKIND